MKITLTQEGLNFSKELRKTLLGLTLTTPSPGICFRQSKQMHTSMGALPKIKGITEVAVKVPHIRVSKDFKTKYPTYNTSNRMEITEYNQERADSLPGSASKLFIQNRLNKTSQKGTTTDQTIKLELQFLKLTEKFNLQMKQRQAIQEMVTQKRKHEEAKRTKKIDTFLRNFSEITKKFEEQLLVNTRKVRKKKLIQRRYLNKYNPFWNKGRLTQLSNPKHTVKRYTEFIESKQPTDL